MGALGNRQGISWIIFRYILREALFSFLVAFIFFFVIFFVNQILLLAEKILTKHVPVMQVATLVFYALPQVVALSAPFASLVGTLMTVGRLTSDNEVLVMLSSGLSYLNVFLPALCMGILISIASFFTNDVLLPAGAVGYNRLYRQIVASTPALELEANSVKRFKDTVIVTGPVEGKAIDNVLILDRTSDGERRVIMARNAELMDAGKEGLSLDLEDAFVQSSKEVVRDDYDYATAGFLRYFVPQEDLLQAVSAISANQMSSLDVGREIARKQADLQSRLDDRRGRVLSQALRLEDSLRKGPAGGDAWNRRETYLRSFSQETQTARVLSDDRSLRVFRLEYNKKFSIPLGAFSFVFLAVPLGLLARKSGQAVGFMFGLFVAFFYWALLLAGQTLGVRLGYDPFWSMWMPNLLALSVGFVLCALRLRN